MVLAYNMKDYFLSLNTYSSTLCVFLYYEQLVEKFFGASIQYERLPTYRPTIAKIALGRICTYRHNTYKLSSLD
jgi:hypothetical protein